MKQERIKDLFKDWRVLTLIILFASRSLLSTRISTTMVT